MNWLVAIGICVAAAAFEGLCAGRDPMAKLRALRQPRWSPPIWGWVAIGIAWYALCLVALGRLVPDFGSRPAPVVLLVALMLGNGAVNLFQFRMERLDLALASFAPYWILLAAFLAVVRPIDPLVFSLFVLYSVYQLYAGAWAFALWRFNRS